MGFLVCTSSSQAAAEELLDQIGPRWPQLCLNVHHVDPLQMSPDMVVGCESRWWNYCRGHVPCFPVVAMFLVCPEKSGAVWRSLELAAKMSRCNTSMTHEDFSSELVDSGNVRDNQRHI